MKILLLMAFISYQFPFPATAASPIAFCKTDQTAACLRSNFKEFISKDYEGFYLLFNKLSNAAASCRSISATADWLSIAPDIEGNAELAEAYGEVTEDLAAHKTKCFLKAVKKLDLNNQRAVAYQLRYAIYVEQAEIDRALKKFEKDSRYSGFVKLYFNP